MRLKLGIIPAGSVVLGVVTLFSYVLGLVRDRFFAQTFGASRLLDSYNAAFLVPDLLFNILVASGIAAALVPILTELLQSDKKRAFEYVNSVITAATGTMTLAAVIMFVFAGPISIAVAPGFSPDDRLLVVKILRVLAVSPIIFGVSNAIGAMLVAKRRFLYYGLSPVLYNAGIIFGTLALSSRYGIMGVALGTILGALLHLAVRAGDAYAQGFRFRPNYDFRTPEFRKTLKLMIPKMFGHPIELATFWGFTVISSTLQPGSVAVLSFARNFQSVPVSLIGITIATTSFPVLAGAISRKEIGEFWKTFKNSFFVIFAGSAAAAILIFLARRILIGLFLGGGAFRPEDVIRTAATLGVFCLSIPTEALVHLAARAFYATKNTVIPVLVSIAGIAIAIPGGYILSSRLDIFALPLAFFMGSGVELLILLVLLRRRVSRQLS